MSISPIHPDFRAVETKWGTHYLHKSNIVWYVFYPLAQRTFGNFLSKTHRTVKGLWVSYFAGRDYDGETPWCEPNYAIKHDMEREQEAVDACLEHLDSLKPAI